MLRVASLLAHTITCGSFKYDISVSSFWENAQAHNLESYLILKLSKIESENLFWLMQKLTLNDLDYFRYEDHVAKKTVE